MSLLHQALKKSPSYHARLKELAEEEKKKSPLQGKCQDIIMKYKEEFEEHERKQQALDEIINNKPMSIHCDITLNDLKEYFKEKSIHIKTNFYCNISGCVVNFYFNINDVKSSKLKNLNIERIHIKSKCYILEMGDFDQFYNKELLDLVVSELTNFDPEYNYISCDHLLERE